MNDLEKAAKESTVNFLCPRCQEPQVAISTYGPCLLCRNELRATMFHVPDEKDKASDYEPKMNVTPNAVALKEEW